MRAEGHVQGDASGLLELGFEPGIELLAACRDFPPRGKGIIAAILHTDMVKHNEMIKELAFRGSSASDGRCQQELSLLYQINSDTLDALKADSVVGLACSALFRRSFEVKSSAGTCQTLMNALLHCADIGNPMKPWEICYQLAHLCLDEFFAQGDMEKERGIPVQMLNDREKVNRPNSQALCGQSGFKKVSWRSALSSS